MRDLFIVGAGGLGRDVIDTVTAINDQTPTWRIVGVDDDAPSPGNLNLLKDLGVDYLGGWNTLPSTVAVALCVGSPSVRARLSGKLPPNTEIASLVHPTTIRGSGFRHGHGLIILPGATIGTNVELGNYVHLNSSAVIGHDTRLDEFVSVNPNATVSGSVVVEKRTLIGAGSVILQGINIGHDSVVGASACVVRNVAPGQTVVGVPAVELPV